MPSAGPLAILLRLLLTLLGGIASCAAPPPVQAKGAGGAPLRVAACQILADGDRDASFEQIDRALAEASRQGAQLALFPARSLFGWPGSDARRLADPIPGPSSNRLAALARRHAIMLAIGLLESDGETLYDATILFDRDGRLLWHRRHPPRDAAPGHALRSSGVEQAAPIPTRHGDIALLAEIELQPEEELPSLADRRPDLWLLPCHWAAPADEWPEHAEALRARIRHLTLRSGVAALAVNAVGTIAAGAREGWTLGGRSTFCETDGSLHPPLAGDRPQVHVFALDRPGRALP